KEWDAARPEKKADYLYSGAPLAVSREWAETHRDELSRLEAAFLTASEEANRRREEEELNAERHLRSIAEAKEVAERGRAEEAEKRKRETESAAVKLSRRNRLLIVVTLCTVGIAAIAGWLAHKADEAAVQANMAEDK